MGKLLQCLLRGTSDEFFIKVYWFKKTHRRIDLDNPKSYNEKIQWMKLNYRDPLMVRYADKLSVKEYVAEKIGSEYVVPLLGVWDRPEDIDYTSLPDRFVLKTTNGSNFKGVLFCKDKNSFDRKDAERKLNKELLRAKWDPYREWAYRDIQPRIIAEELLEDDSPHNQGGLSDYKFYCFNGKVHYALLCTDRNTKVKYYFLDRDWKLQRINKDGRMLPEDAVLERPAHYEEMIEVCEKLAADFPLVRVDLYLVNDRIYFGEMTFYSGGGFSTDRTWESDLKWGEELVLPR